MPTDAPISPIDLNRILGMRPHFEIINWRTPGGGDGDNALPNQPAPQLSGPVATPPAAASTSTSISTAAVQPQAKSGKPTIDLVNGTLNAMGEPKPVRSSEFYDDEIAF